MCIYRRERERERESVCVCVQKLVYTCLCMKTKLYTVELFFAYFSLRHTPPERQKHRAKNALCVRHYKVQRHVQIYAQTHTDIDMYMYAYTKMCT